MMKLIFTTCLLLIFLAACDRPECRNTNPVFDHNAPASEAYKRELAIRIRAEGRSRLRYWFDRYVKDADGEHILIYVQGGGLCAEAHVLVADWPERARGLRGGGGYRGAELEGFKMDIRQDSARTEFVFRGLDGIID